MTASQNTPQLLIECGHFPAIHFAGRREPLQRATRVRCIRRRAGPGSGSVANDIEHVLRDEYAKMPRGTSIVMRGQVQSMRESFIGLAFGLLFAVLLVYFLMVVNFQSWLDPLIILMALPGAFAALS